MKVELLDHNASDLKVVNAARVSYNTHHDELTEGDKKLINAMVREGHGSVFEHCTFSWRVECPFAVARQWHRHRIGHSYNEMSGRYIEMPENFHVPRPRAQEGKAMAYEYVDLPDAVTKRARKWIEESYANSYADYETLLGAGVAKEVARYVLPLGMETQFYWSNNARSLMHFLALRTHHQAGEEIRELANNAEDRLQEIMPFTWKAFVDNGRKAP